MTSVTYTGVLDVSRATAEALAKLLLEHRERLGTRKGTRALGPFKQSVLILRWFLDGTRLTQLARDNRISVPTAYRYLHEGLTVLADHAPDLSTALERAAAAGCTHLNLDGTVIRTDRVTAPGPNKADLWWSGKHKHHGGNVQVCQNPNWGYRRIHGELAALGIKVAATVWNILKEHGIDPASDRDHTTWANFLSSRAQAIVAADFFETKTLTGATLYVLAVIEHATRRVRILGTTAHPTAASWTWDARSLVLVRAVTGLHPRHRRRQPRSPATVVVRKSHDTGRREGLHQRCSRRCRREAPGCRPRSMRHATPSCSRHR
ncbi:hypothetical protein [Streptomyces sp. NBC_01483]|uniref:hypothetical protein n=1 Tax=Streptomyces sp. NBC_01483 TaxID=2903883 RepID=UPI003FCDF74A